MRLKHFFLLASGLSLFVFSCSRQDPATDKGWVPKTANHALKYAERFAIQKEKGYTLVYLFGKRESLDTTATYLISDHPARFKKDLKHPIFIQLPCKKIAALSSIYANILCELNALDRLVAIDNSDYLVNPKILSKYQRGQLQELSKGPELDLEKTIALRPDIIFTFGTGDPSKDVNPRLLQSGIPVAVSLDHLERSPLARAEWIKFYGVFIGQEALADSLFSRTEKNYRNLQTFAKKADGAPSVFNGIKYGDTWYLPGGQSYMAQLLKDAHADYIWKNDSSTGSFPRSFEQVYTKAKDADFWINLSMVNSKAELVSYESRYSEFKAFKTSHLYNNNKVINAKGYSTYWETGMIYPDKVLNDLITIFHPELLAGTKNDLYYYKQIK